MDKGVFICTTLGSSRGKTVAIIIYSIIIVSLGVLMIANLDSFSDDDKSLIMGGIVAAFTLPTIFIVYHFTKKRSYLTVYENCVEGISIVEPTNVLSSPDCKLTSFLLQYKEILQVDISQQKLVLYTPYMKYEVNAQKNLQFAYKEIRKRIGKEIIE